METQPVQGNEPTLKIEVEEMFTNGESEYWIRRVTIRRDTYTYTILVHMNTDTIVCWGEGEFLPFKTYGWYEGDVDQNAVITATRYLQWLDVNFSEEMLSEEAQRFVQEVNRIFDDANNSDE